MNSKQVALVILISLISILPSSVFAEDPSDLKTDSAQLIAKISLPTEDALVRANVPIFGLAYGKGFEKYRVEYGEGPDPKEWIEIAASTTPQKEDVNINEIAVGDQTLHGNLATWGTGLSNYVYGEHPVDLNGVYTVRLLVFSKDGQKAEDKVTVEVGRVIPRVYGGTVESKDNRVVLSIPEQAINDSFKVFGIKPVIDKDISIPEGYRLVGKVYVIRPQGERFTKDAVLEMSYLENDLKSSDEKKVLGIYAYNPKTGNWDYMPTICDIKNNTLKTSISNITSGVAYYSILAKAKPPLAPLLYRPYSPTPLKLITVKGESEPNVELEIFVNGKSQDKSSSDKDTGIFSLSNILLNDGKNLICAQAIDPFGQTSPVSESVICEVISNSPKKIERLQFTDENFSNKKSGSVCLGDKLYIELKGKDINPNTIDTADVKLLSSASDPKGIEIQLLETGYDTGIYRGIATVSKESSIKESKISARKNKETIKVISTANPDKRDKIVFLDLMPPSSPNITSATHSSLIQNTFEDGLGSWVNRDKEKGAAVSLDNTGTKDGTYCLKLTNQSYRGNFASTIIPRSFDAKEYPLVSFDYKISPDIKINFLAKVNGKWYEVEFTGAPKRYIRLNMEKIGKIEGVIADDKWHTAQFNLCQMLKQKTDESIIEEMAMANWDESGYMKLEYGRNKENAAYFIDNLKIIKLGFANPNVEFTFAAEDDLSKNLEYSFCFDQSPNTLPDTISEGADSFISYQNIPDGEWYFHVRARDEAGNWGKANHYWIKIDTKSPIVDLTIPAGGSNSADRKIILHLTDGGGTGVDPETIKLKINSREYDVSNPALSYDRVSETLTFTPSLIGALFKDKEKVAVELIEANDFCGNSIDKPIEFSFVMDYSKDTIKPNPPKVYALVSYAADKNLASFSWDSDEPIWIKGYSLLLDRNPETSPHNEIDSHATSQVYNNLEPGIWYFHIRCQDKAGNWSEPAHYKAVINNTKDRSVLLIDDFDNGKGPNKLGGGFYYFSNPKADGKCEAIYHKEKKGYSLTLSYEVLGAEDYTGYWTSLEGVDLTGYNTLNFWVKKAKANELMRIGLRDSRGVEPKVKLGDYLTDESVNGWQKAIIPLSSFVGISDFSKMEGLSFAFENWMGMKEDVIYIDNIHLTKQVASLVVDDFDDGKDPNFVGGGNWVFNDGLAKIQTDYFEDKASKERKHCYRISYSGVKKERKDNTTETYCGYLAMLNGLNAFDYNTLSFWIKGRDGDERPNIYLDDGTNVEYVDNHLDLENYVTVTTSWQKVNIPLIDFVRRGVNISRLKMLKVVFEWDDMEGVIFIDDVEFVTRLEP